MFDRVKLRHLTFFLEAARNGSLAKAADRLNVSQPAVTKTIRELETVLDVQLFHRSPGGVSLTKCGEALFDHAVAVFAELRAGLSRVDAVKKGEEGRLTVGTVAVAGSRLVRTTIARLKQRSPFVTVTVMPGSIDRLLSSLRMGEIDLVIGRPGELNQMQGIAREMLLHDRLALVVRAGHPLVSAAELRLSEMTRFPWVLPLPNTPTRQRLDAVFREQGLATPPDVIEGIVSAFTQDYIDQTDSIAALPFSLVAEEIHAGRLAELTVEMKNGLGKIEIMHQESVALSSPARQFIRELRRHVARFRQAQNPPASGYNESRKS